VLATSAIAMLALLLAAGLAVDISHFYTAKAELQNAADAASLAAASQLNSTSGGIKTAVGEATKVLNKYDFKMDVTIPANSITFSDNLNGTYVDQATAETNATQMRFVKVIIPPKPVNVFFAGTIIGQSKNIGATATAGMSVGLTMNKFYTAYTFIQTSAAPMTPGTVYTLNAKSWNDNSPTSYRVLAGPGGDLVLTGSIHAYGYIGTSYNIAKLTGTSPSGNLSAPSMCRYAQIGMNTRFGDYTVHPSANNTDEPPDTIIEQTITYQQYRTMQGNGVVQRSDGMRNRRIMTIPIANNSSYNTTNGTVSSVQLAPFFIRRKVGTDCTLQVEYIGGPMAVPVGTYEPGLSQMGGLSIPVIYK
jgi:Flp pilus assembly protein TadG